MPRRITVATVATALAATGVAAAPQATSAVQHSTVVGTNPADRTPHVLDGTVRAIAKVGSRIIVGGNFTKVRNASSKTEIARKNLFAFDFATGKVDPNFKPEVNSTVYALQTGDKGTVYAAGGFWIVNGAQTGGLVQLNATNGARVTAFNPNVGGGLVYDIKRKGAKLYLGGTFTKVRRTPRQTLAAVNAATGALDAGFTVTPSDPRAGALKVYKMALNPQGTKLLINGTFTRVDGERRVQIAMIDTGSATAELASWSTEQYSSTCNINSFHTYMRGMDFSPDGSYFVVVTTGGPYGPRTLCDTAARWESDETGGNQRPTWVNHTGGDTLLSTAVTGAAVYVGGHQRWHNNPYGSGYAGPGAVSRPGIAALDPATGKALSWNPTRSRGHGVEALVVIPRGLFVGSDTDQLGKEYHGRIGYFPLP